jgi:cytochrome c551/c552
MKKGSLLFAALLTAVFISACENKQHGGEQQAEQTTTEEQTTTTTTEEQTTTTEEQATEEKTEEATGGEEGGEENGGEEAGGEETGGEEGGETAAAGGGGGNAVEKGKQLFTSKGCGACHQPNADTVGPSLAKIAQAYAGKKEDLIKFLKGEGQAIVDPAKFAIMQPNLNQLKGLSDEDLEAIAEYILSVK